MKDCTDCIRKNNPEYTKCYCAIYKEHPEKCNYKIRFECPQTEQAEASSLSDLLSAEPTTAQIHDACLSYRHDYGLMGPVESEDLRWKAILWLRSWKKAYGI